MVLVEVNREGGVGLESIYTFRTDPKSKGLSEIGLKKVAEVGSVRKLDVGIRDALNTPDFERVMRTLESKIDKRKWTKINESMMLP